jgi:hypothetical protein
MGARRKLNSAFFNGSLLIAVFIGILAGSWLVFGVALVVMLAINLHSGEIRPFKRP